MRLTAYMEALQQTLAIPTEIPEFRRYFNNYYNPRLTAIYVILMAARKDEALLHSDLHELILRADDIELSDTNFQEKEQTK